MTWKPRGRGTVGAAGASLAILAGLAAPAYAHVNVTADPAQAGAREALVTFSLAAESGSAGISSVAVQLPEGIAPGDVSLVDGPAGWQLAPTNDGYEISGPALPVGEDLSYSIRVAQLPTETITLFKTLQNYTDGRQDAWIEEPNPDGSEPQRPAPALTLAPAPPEPTPTPTPRPTVTISAVATTPAAAPTSAAEVVSGDGGSAGPWLVAAVVVAAAAVVGSLVVRRRAAAGRS